MTEAYDPDTVQVEHHFTFAAKAFKDIDTTAGEDS